MSLAEFDDSDVDGVIDYLTSAEIQPGLARLVARRLGNLEGFSALPADLQGRITEQVLLLYAGGYLHAVTEGRKPKQ